MHPDDQELALAPAAQAGALGFHLDARRRDLLNRTLMPDGSTDDELELFAMVCERTGLDPFARQIYPMRNKATGKLTFQASIDGFRLVTQRTGRYEGQTPYEWCGRDRVWREVWLPEDGDPVAARVGVHMRGYREPLYAVAHWHEYAQTTNNGDAAGRWRTGGAQMLAKCAEALAHRRAAPQELAGVYSEEEASVIDVTPPAGSRQTAARPPQRAQGGGNRRSASNPAPARPKGDGRDFTAFWRVAKAAGYSREEVIRDICNGTDPGALEREEFDLLIERFREEASDGVPVEGGAQAGTVIEGEAREVTPE